MIKFVDVIEDNNWNRSSKRLIYERMHESEVFKMSEEQGCEYTNFELWIERRKNNSSIRGDKGDVREKILPTILL